MLNHIHGIVWISDSQDDDGMVPTEIFTGVGATGRSPLRKEPSCRSGPAPKSLGAFVAGFKSSVTKRINQMRNTPGIKVWMQNCHDRIIRSEKELREIRRCIVENPLKRELDHENPDLHLLHT